MSAVKAILISAHCALRKESIAVPEHRLMKRNLKDGRIVDGS